MREACLALNYHIAMMCIRWCSVTRAETAQDGSEWLSSGLCYFCTGERDPLRIGIDF
jgi:hypothetical protein